MNKNILLSRNTYIIIAVIAVVLLGGFLWFQGIEKEVAKPTKELKILQWDHFVPGYDKWFDSFAKQWGEANGVNVIVDHINIADITKRTVAEIAAGEGHDLIEHVSPPASFELDNRGLFTTIGPIVYSGQDSIIAIGNRYFFSVTLGNNGSITTANDIGAKITTSDTCVTSFSSRKASYGDITAGGSITPSTPNIFDVEIDQNCASTEEMPIPFDIEISSDGYTYWTDNFELVVPPIIGVEDEMAGIPTEYSLSNAYPNPFNPMTTIEYSLPNMGEVSLIVYNLLGEEVTRLISEIQQAGYHKVTWDASNNSSGIYFYRLQSGRFTQARKMALLK